VFVACLLGLLGTYILFVEAPPSGRVVIATGGKDGAYHRFAEKYAELLKAEGIQLEILTTQGTVENLKLLLDRDSEVRIAFVQTGIANPDECEKLQALGSLYREPLWVFYRGDQFVDRLTQLKGKRVRHW